MPSLFPSEIENAKPGRLFQESMTSMQITVARMCHATLEAIEQDVMDTAASDPARQRSVRRSWILLSCLNIGGP